MRKRVNFIYNIDYIKDLEYEYVLQLKKYVRNNEAAEIIGSGDVITVCAFFFSCFIIF